MLSRLVTDHAFLGLDEERAEPFNELSYGSRDVNQKLQKMSAVVWKQLTTETKTQLTETKTTRTTTHETDVFHSPLKQLRAGQDTYQVDAQKVAWDELCEHRRGGWKSCSDFNGLQGSKTKKKNNWFGSILGCFDLFKQKQSCCLMFLGSQS